MTLKTLFTDLNEAFREISTLDYGKGILPVGLITHNWLPFPNSGKAKFNAGSLFSEKAVSISLGSLGYRLHILMS
ncbi:hypothetical protein G6677_01140 [Polynucleobacter paneuropaeus]|nr:hypothetical protein [Polynucleobacter paneuropaeus]